MLVSFQLQCKADWLMYPTHTHQRKEEIGETIHMLQDFQRIMVVALEPILSRHRDLETIHSSYSTLRRALTTLMGTDDAEVVA